MDLTYDGWNPTYNEVDTPFHSARLGPFRFYTQGYTGAKSKPQRKDFKFEPERLMQMKDKIQGLIDGNETFEDGYAATQFM